MYATKNKALSEGVTAAFMSGYSTRGNAWEFKWDYKNTTEHLTAGLATGLSTWVSSAGENSFSGEAGETSIGAGIGNSNNSPSVPNVIFNDLIAGTPMMGDLTSGAIYSSLMTGMYHATGGKGFKNNYYDYDWNSLVFDHKDIGNALGNMLVDGLKLKKYGDAATDWTLGFASDIGESMWNLVTGDGWNTNEEVANNQRIQEGVAEGQGMQEGSYDYYIAKMMTHGVQSLTDEEQMAFNALDSKPKYDKIMMESITSGPSETLEQAPLNEEIAIEKIDGMYTAITGMATNVETVVGGIFRTRFGDEVGNQMTQYFVNLFGLREEKPDDPGANQRNNEHTSIAEGMCNLNTLARSLFAMGEKVPNHAVYSQFEDILEEMRMKLGLDSREYPDTLLKLALNFKNVIDTNAMENKIYNQGGMYNRKYKNGIFAINHAYENDSPLGLNYKRTNDEEVGSAFAKEYYHELNKYVDLRPGKDQVLMSNFFTAGHYIRLLEVKKNGAYIFDSYGKFDTKTGAYKANPLNREYTYGNRYFLRWKDIYKYNVGITFKKTNKYRSVIILKRK